jgi:hypothetical protein
MNGTSPNFKNLRVERQGNCDKRKKILEAIYQSDQSEYSMVFVYCSTAHTKVIHIAIYVSLIYLFCRSYPLKYLLFNHFYILSSLLEVFVMLNTSLEH